MDQSVFTYGTLQLPAVMEAVTGRTFRCAPATLCEHARYTIKRRIYPGIVPEGGSRVDGCLYFNLDDAAIRCLDAFEDVLYVRQAVRVACANRMITAQVYVLSAKYRKLLNAKPWDLEDFRRHYLADYLKSCRRFHAAFVRDHP